MGKDSTALNISKYELSFTYRKPEAWPFPELMALTVDLYDFLTFYRFDLNMSTAADEEKEASSALKLPRYNYGIIMTCDFPDENKLVPDMIGAVLVAQMVEHF